MLGRWKAQEDLSGSLIPEITRSIQSLHDKAKFFVDLVKMNEEPNFTGTLHCEACIASLLNHSVNDDRKYEDLLIQLKVGYAISNVFVIGSSILVIGLWTSYRSFKALLPSV